MSRIIRAHFPDNVCKKHSGSIFHTDAEYQRKTRSVSSPVQNVGADYRQDETQCFITRYNTEKRVENTTRSEVFLTTFEVFHLVMKH